ncbi:TerD family protein [Vibrio splendidus]|nr:TerD family protein [Vibrio splendidus]MCC4883099.1 TerD family protein [Vibrio splendidus]
MNAPKYTIKNITKLLAVLSWKDEQGQHSDLDIAMDFVSKTGVRAMPKIYFGNETGICATYFGDNKGQIQNEHGYSQEIIALNTDKVLQNVSGIFISIINNDKNQMFSDFNSVIIQLVEAESKDVVFELDLKSNESTSSCSAVIPLSFEIEAGSISVSECPFVAVNTYPEDVHAQYFNTMAM